MDSRTGRHRSAGVPTWVLVAGVWTALLLGVLAGVGLQRLLGPDEPTAQGDAVPAVSASAPPTVATPPPSPAPRPAPEQALPDPSKPGPREAYLAALEESGVPIGEHRELLLDMGGQLCREPPPPAGPDPAASAQRITALFGQLWTPEQATQIVVAAQQLC